MTAFTDEDRIEEFMRTHSTAKSRRHASRRLRRRVLQPTPLPVSKNGEPVVGDVVGSQSWPGTFLIIGLATHHETVDRYGKYRNRRGGFHLLNVDTGQLCTVGGKDLIKRAETDSSGRTVPMSFGGSAAA